MLEQMKEEAQVGIKSLIDQLRSFDNCIIHPPKGIPKPENGHKLPYDITQFYKLCGGIDLFINTDGFSYSILSPEKVVLANPVLLGEELAEEIWSDSKYRRDITLDCYLIAHDRNGDYLVIDLNENRLGLCYDAFHETYGLAGNMPIIAGSFTDLLRHLIENKGQSIYWLDDNFTSLGDAYENSEE